ncbi:MAG: Hsp20/alpha crystallin family protein [Thermoanaerobaculia bacterium]|nr:Hsp20/alpha crystallin family protein [Thermoanaerobaculia bacterium]
MLTRYRKTSPTVTAARDPFFSFVDRFFNEVGFPAGENGADTSDRWLPPVDIQETDDAFVVSADLPGLSKDDIDISLEDGVLTLAGERKFSNEETEGKTFRRIERSYGSFRRSFTLPQGVDAKKVNAKFTDGELHLTLPKSATAKPRKITIS